MKNEAEELEPLKNSARLASEYIVPGGSNLIEGDFAQGAIHVVLGIFARSIFGLPGLIAVSANSFTKATTGRHIHEHLGLEIGQKQKEQTGQKGSQSALTTQSPPVSPVAYSSPQSAAKRRQPSSKKRPSSSKTSK